MVMKVFWKNITKQTTINGLNNIGLENLHKLERIFWSILTMMATLAAIYLNIAHFQRYIDNPTVVSIKKDYRNWKNPFPAVTGCLVNKTDYNKASKYIYKKWNINTTNPNYNYYLNFIETIADISYTNLYKFEKYRNNKFLNNIDMIEIAKEVYPELSGNLVTFDTKHKTYWTLIMSEMGICFSINNKYAHLLSIKSPENPVNILHCHYLNGLCYARLDSDPHLPVKYYIHSYLDVIHATIDPPLIVNENEELDINFRLQETITSLNLKYLTPYQRRCRFDDESYSKNLPVFTTSFCYILCRYEMAKKLCGCIPFFYRFLGGKVCDVEGLWCLGKFARNFTLPPTQIGCVCPQPCHIINYVQQKPKYTKWESGYFDQRIVFRWALIHPTTKFQKDIIFGFQDLVVAFGNTLSLFLGMSFISGIEFIFLIIININNNG